MDGTLTIPQHDFAEIRQRLHVPENQDILQSINSRPHEEQTKAHRMLYEWELDLAYSAKPDPYAVQLLERLHENNHKLGLLTRNLTELAMITLKAIQMQCYFTIPVILGRDAAIPKPNPAGILKICSHHKIKPEDTVMVGDYVHDSRAGKAAGCRTILIDSQNRFEEETSFDLRISSLEKLITET